MKLKWLREINGFQEIAHKFQEIGYSGIVPFMYEGKEEIHKNMQYVVSMTVSMGRTTNNKKILKWQPFKNYKSGLLNI